MSLRWKTYFFIGFLAILVVLIASSYHELILNAASIEKPLLTQNAVETSTGLEPGFTYLGTSGILYQAYPYPPPQAYTGPNLEPVPILPDYSPFN
jgi:hypothetical protein